MKKTKKQRYPTKTSFARRKKEFFMTKILFFMIFLLSTISSICSNVLHLSAGESVIISEGNSNIVSRGGIFEMGIFKSSRERYSKIDRWFLGIWFRNQPTNIVWVANKEEPLYNPTGNIKVSHFDIILLNHSGGIVWKSPLTEVLISNAKLVAELHDNGNFMLRYSSRSSNNNNTRNHDGTLWQSFDYPTDTLLPGMQLILGSNSLTSWATSRDPSDRDVEFRMDASSGKVFQGYVWEKRNRRSLYRIDPSYTSSLFNITISMEKVAYSLREGMNAALQVNRIGYLMLWEWSTSGEWKIQVKSSLPADYCDIYNICGSNNYCEMKPLHTCRCILGFQRSDKPPFKCVRQAHANCLEDTFWAHKSVKLPETTMETIVDTKLGLEECKTRCLKDCNCTAFAIASLQNGGSGCVMWTGDLIDIRSYKNDKGQDLFVRVAGLGQNKNKNRSRNKTIIGLTVGVSGLLLIGFMTLCFLKRRKKKARAIVAAASRESNRNIPLELTEDWNSANMEFDDIAEATNNFSDTNQIGRGGFGIVYKGRLLDGQEVAVKRLTEMSPQGIEGFNNEVRFIAVVQHVNIVRLLGYFSNRINKILVYEFLENSSLDTYLFDTTRKERSFLKWDQRLDITNGIARGLLYLHQDSRFRIIHLDMKPSNILLGKDMVPKISDFGLAQILRADETEATVTRVAGSFGYMAPEYAREKVYSAKSDVFSFGVLLLEIVSGKKNSEFSRLNDGDNLLKVIWNHWSEGKGLEIVDPVIKDSSSGFQLKQCVQIGLLCVQELAVDRPTMSSVVSMLGSDVTQQIPQAKSPDEPGSLREGESSFTIPQITMSIFDTR